jgi:hypothetical protein
VPKRTVKSCGPDASVVGVKSAEGKSARPVTSCLFLRYRLQSFKLGAEILRRSGMIVVISWRTLRNPSLTSTEDLNERIKPQRR